MTRRDRDHYRGLQTTELLDEVKYALDPDWQELAIVLAERIVTMRREYDYDYDD